MTMKIDRQTLIDAAHELRITPRDDSTELIAGLLGTVERDEREAILSQMVTDCLDGAWATQAGTDAEHAYLTASTLEDIAEAARLLARMLDPLDEQTFPSVAELQDALNKVA